MGPWKREVKSPGTQWNHMTSTKLLTALSGISVFVCVFSFWIIPRLPDTRIRHPDVVYDIAYSHDGANLATACGDGKIRVWSTSHRKLVAVLPAHGSFVSSLEFSSDDRLLATAGSYDGTAKIWNTSDWSLLKTLTGHTDSVTRVRFSPDAATLATSSFDMTVRLWDVTTGELKATLGGLDGVVNGLAYSHDGQVIAGAASSGQVGMWEATTGQLKAMRPCTELVIHSLAFSPDGMSLAVACYDGTVRLIDSGDWLKQSVLHTRRPARCVTFSRDGLLLAAGTGGMHPWPDDPAGETIVWRTPDLQEVARFRGHWGAHMAVQFAPTMNVVATGSDDSTVALWKLRSE